MQRQQLLPPLQQQQPVADVGWLVAATEYLAVVAEEWLLAAAVDWAGPSLQRQGGGAYQPRRVAVAALVGGGDGEGAAGDAWALRPGRQ